MSGACEHLRTAGRGLSSGNSVRRATDTSRSNHAAYGPTLVLHVVLEGISRGFSAVNRRGHAPVTARVSAVRGNFRGLVRPQLASLHAFTKRSTSSGIASKSG